MTAPRQMGELTALRILVTQLVVRDALAASDPAEALHVLKTEALDALAGATIAADNPAAAGAYRAEAEATIRAIFDGIRFAPHR